MNACLVTKLKGTVNNDNLPVFGALTFETEGNGKVISKAIINPVPVTIKILSGDATLNIYETPDVKLKELKIPANYAGWITITDSTDSSSIISINNKYNINILVIDELIKSNSFDISKLSYMNNLKSFGCYESSNRMLIGKLNDIEAPLKSLKNFSVNDIATTFEGNLIDIPKYYPALENITLFNLSSDFAFKGCDLVDFIKEYIKQGRTEGTITTGWFRTNQVTFNGQPMENTKYDDQPITWTEHSISIAGETVEI